MTAVGGMAISRAPGITKLADRQPLQSLYEGNLLENHKARNHIVFVIALAVYHVKEFVHCFLKRKKNEFFHLLQGQQLSLAALG